MNIAIILSGGIGSRMKLNLPKQYVIVNNRPIISYCIETFLNHKMIDAIVIGAADEWKDFIKKNISYSENGKKEIYFSKPGETRQHSIYNALKTISKMELCDKSDNIIIHDAARPLVSDNLISACLLALNDNSGVLPVIPVKDTIYQSIDGLHISSLLHRNELYAGQTPEAFKFGEYKNLHDRMSYEDICKINGSTEIAYKAGLSIKLIRGEEMNFKITTPEDLSNFENIINK